MGFLIGFTTVSVHVLLESGLGRDSELLKPV